MHGSDGRGQIMPYAPDYSELLKYCISDAQRRIIGCLGSGLTQRQVATELKCNPRSVSRCLERVRRQAARRHYDPEHQVDNPLPPTLTSSGISEFRKEILPDGTPVNRWYKSKEDNLTRLNEIISRLEDIEYRPAPVFPVPKTKQYSELLNLYTITDFHLGMYAWAPETGDDWDTEIAGSVLINAIQDMANRAPNSEIAILNIQGDFLHWDGLEAVTPTNRHTLDADTRYGRLVDLSMDLVMWAIEILAKKHKNVRVKITKKRF